MISEKKLRKWHYEIERKKNRISDSTKFTTHEDKKSARESVWKDCVTIIQLPGNKYLGYVPVDAGSADTIADAIFAYENIC